MPNSSAACWSCRPRASFAATSFQAAPCAYASLDLARRRVRVDRIDEGDAERRGTAEAEADLEREVGLPLGRREEGRQHDGRRRREPDVGAGDRLGEPRGGLRCAHRSTSPGGRAPGSPRRRPDRSRGSGGT